MMSVRSFDVPTDPDLIALQVRRLRRRPDVFSAAEMKAMTSVIGNAVAGDQRDDHRTLANKSESDCRRRAVHAPNPRARARDPRNE